MLRRLRASDFKNPYDVIEAIYNGNSGYLHHGQKYNVTLNHKSGKITVKQCHNPKMRTNGGMQFTIGRFFIQEDDVVMIHLDDLSADDRERLLKEAREAVEQENIAKDAAAMYAIKKKELVNNTVDAMVHTLKLKSGPQASKCKDRFVHMTNYLYALNKPDANRSGNVPKILTNEDWVLFKYICEKVYECMVYCVKPNNITEV